jgi:hypothetical protein
MRPPVIAALVLALVATSAPATAAPRLRGVPARVRAGTALEITWTGLAPEAHEVELELSLGGGRWVRISPELEAREGVFAWRVPAALSGPARLRLRYGGEGFEAEGDATPFVIEADAGAPMTLRPDPGLGEWWCLGQHSGAPPSGQVSGAASLHATDRVVAIAHEPDRPARPRESPLNRPSSRGPTSTLGDVVQRRGSGSRFHPLRI